MLRSSFFLRLFILVPLVFVCVSCIVSPVYIYGETKEFERLKAAAEELSEKAVKFFKRAETVGAACKAFIYDPVWRRGPVHMQLLSDEGVMYFSNDYSDFIWGKEPTRQNIFQRPLLQTVLKFGNTGGGWVSQFAFNSIQHGFVKIVKRRGRRYILAAVFFYEAPELIASLLIEGIKVAWPKVGAQKIFSMVSNPYGSLIIGSSYVSIADIEGTYWAHGINPSLIGQNVLLDTKEAVELSPAVNAAKLVKLAVEKTNNPEGKAWVEYEDHGMLRRVYVERFTDTVTQKTYVIMSGFFPDLSEETAVSCAVAASKILEEMPKGEALMAISRARIAYPTTVTKGNLLVQVTDAQGVIIADTHDARVVGTNAFEYVDERRNSLSLLKTRLERNGKAWMTTFRNNAFERIYARVVETKEEKYMVIVRGYFPYQQEEVASAMVDDAFELFSNYSRIGAILDFKKPISVFTPSMFIKGDMKLSIYDDKGICWFTARGVRDFWAQDSVITALPQGWVDDERGFVHKRLHIKRLPKLVAPNKIENYTFVVSFHV